MELEEDIKNLSEIIHLCEDDIKNNNNNVTATLDLEDLKSLKTVLEALENLIPKKKIEDKKEGYWESCCNKAVDNTINIFQELLEDK